MVRGADGFMPVPAELIGLVGESSILRTPFPLPHAPEFLIEARDCLFRGEIKGICRQGQTYLYWKDVSYWVVRDPEGLRPAMH